MILRDSCIYIVDYFAEVPFGYSGVITGNWYVFGVLLTFILFEIRSDPGYPGPNSIPDSFFVLPLFPSFPGKRDKC